MKITIENCGNIDKGTIEIKPGCLNIKYANNGTGKSTIAKTIRAFTSQDNKEKKKLFNELVPYQYSNLSKKEREKHAPSIAGLDNIHNVEIFNDEYVNQFLFTKDDSLLEGAFSIFVETPEYKENMERIRSQFYDITEKIKNLDSLNAVIALLENFVKKCGRGGIIAKDSIIEKSLGTGNSLAEIAPQFKDYESFLLDRTNYNNGAWVSFISKGQPFLKDNHSCPFCLSTDKAKNIEITKEISAQYDEKALRELTEVLENFKNIADYLNDDFRFLLQKLETEAKGLDDESRDKLSSLKGSVADILTKFNDLQKINATSISDIDKLLKDIQSKKISLEGTPFGKKMQDIADEVNSFFDLIYKQALVIKNDIDKQSEIIDSTIKTNQNSINDFLKTAGYNYEVKIEQENENATITLHPIGLENSIENAKDHLSYGERNAFAMVLFMFSAVKKNPDLIILDDPISSFDGNKKFALLNMMFLSSNPDSIGQEDQTKYALLKDKTVLLMTHDFTTILDTVHTLHMCFQNTQAHMLSSKKGIIDGEEKRIIEEKKITHSDFRSFRAIAVSIIKNKENSIVTRVIYLRRLLDFLGEKKEPPYHLLSSLMHGREKPTFETENNREMSNCEIQNASLEIKEDKNFPANIEDFDYFKILNIIQDDEQLKTIYKSSNDYEKVHIFCMYMRKHKDSVHDVLQKYASEFAHIENDSIYQLDPTKFSLIPQYIIEACNKIMGQA